MVRQKKCEDIQYPIFTRLKEVTDDPFWQDVFNKCSYGIFPKPVMNKGNMLFVKKGSVTVRHLLSTDISAENEMAEMLQIKNFFMKYVGISSSNDANIVLERNMEGQKEISAFATTSWSRIRTKNIKQFLIDQYALRLKSEHHLSKKEFNYVTYLFKMANIFNCFAREDAVEYDDGEITNIEGFSIVTNPDGSKTFHFPLLEEEMDKHLETIDQPKKARRSKKAEVSSYYSTSKKNDCQALWEAYIDNLTKGK